MCERESVCVRKSERECVREKEKKIGGGKKEKTHTHTQYTYLLLTIVLLRGVIFAANRSNGTTANNVAVVGASAKTRK